MTFEGFSPQTIDFMWNLRFNNNKAWFEENKAEFKEHFQTPMNALKHEVFTQISAAHSKYNFTHKLSRIYKDARRVRDGEPYRCNLWFIIEKPNEEWTSTPVFWFELAPESWSYGLGYYQAKPLIMAKFRARLDRDPQTFAKLIAPLAQQKEFLLDGEEYKRKKEGAAPEMAEWYNKKSFSLIHSEKNGKDLFSPKLAERLVKGYEFLMPLYDYFLTLNADPNPDER